MNPFQTSDLDLASTLSVLGFVIHSLDKSDTRAVFTFILSESLSQALQNYWAGRILVEPTRLFTERKMLRKRIYSIANSF